MIKIGDYFEDCLELGCSLIVCEIINRYKSIVIVKLVGGLEIKYVENNSAITAFFTYKCNILEDKNGKKE